MGALESYTEGKTSTEWIETLYEGYRRYAAEDGIEVPGLDGLREVNWLKLPISYEGPNPSFLRRFRDDPEAAPLGTPSGRLEIFSDTIDGFGYADCPGHPVWLPPSEWLGAARAEAPLHLVSPQPGDKLHSQLEAALADRPGARPETLVMHPEDAAARGIASGDLVRVFNARGAVRARPGSAKRSVRAWWRCPQGRGSAIPATTSIRTAIPTCSPPISAPRSWGRAAAPTPRWSRSPGLRPEPGGAGAQPCACTVRSQRNTSISRKVVATRPNRSPTA